MINGSSIRVKTRISYQNFSEAILSYMAWVYTSTVLDREKKVCLCVQPNQITIGIKASNILVNQVIEAYTEGIQTEWNILLDYKVLKDIAETYKNLMCTYIEEIEFEETQNGVEMHLYEKPKEGFPSRYSQIQTYKFPQTDFSKGKYKPLETETITNETEAKGVVKWLDSLVPKLKQDTQIQFEKEYSMVKSLKAIYAYKNPIPEIFEDGYALTYAESVFTRQLAKYTRGALRFAKTNNFFVLKWGSCIAYMTKSKVHRPMYSIFKHEPYVWTVKVQGGYFEDVLRRYHSVDEEVLLSTQEEGLMTLQAQGIKQNMVAEVSENGKDSHLFIDTRIMNEMILQKTSEINLGFVEKKSRGKSQYYMCFMTGDKEAPWVSIVQVRKG